MTSSPLPISVLISGSGTTLHNLIEKINSGILNARIVLVISSRQSARGLGFATAANIPSRVISRMSFPTPEEFSDAVFHECRAAGTQLVVMGGYLTQVPIPSDFENRVVNTHPALIPAFCGKGMYGHHVHDAVLAYGAKISGCTIHFVDNVYDHGPIILQRAVPVRDDDTADTLAARVFEAECQAYPEVINHFASGRLSVNGRHVSIRDA